MSKAWLPWFDGWALTAIGEKLDEACRPILLSKAPGQTLPSTPKSWRIVDDETPDAGPLAALATAYRALDDDAFAGALVATCDQPPEALASLTRVLLDGLDGTRSRIFFDGERRQPFPGYYSASALSRIEDLRRQGVASMHAFLDAIADETDTIPREGPFADWDDPASYLAAAKQAGFDPPAWCCEALSRRT